MARATYWHCRGCGTRNQRAWINCRGEGCSRTRPKKRVPKHAATLRDDSYELYVEVAKVLHGVTDEACCVCGRPKHEAMRHHRDHDHVTGKPRGLACFQCNSLMPRLLTLERARLVVAYLERAARFDAEFEQAAQMFPLPPNEAAVIAEIFRLFPGTREVTEGGDGPEVLASVGSSNDAGVVERPERLPAPVSPSVTSQASLFDHPPRRAA